MCMCMCSCRCSCVYMHTYVYSVTREQYVCVCVYIWTYTHIYVHTYIHTVLARGLHIVRIYLKLFYPRWNNAFELICKIHIFVSFFFIIINKYFFMHIVSSKFVMLSLALGSNSSHMIHHFHKGVPPYA